MVDPVVVAVQVSTKTHLQRQVEPTVVQDSLAVDLVV
jgi:hypothetical protein